MAAGIALSVAAAEFIKSLEIKEVINSWLNAARNTTSTKTITICNDTTKYWRFWIGDGWTRDSGLRWLDPDSHYVHTFKAYHNFIFNTNHLARVYCRDDDTYAGFSVYNDGVPCEDNLLVIQDKGVSYLGNDGNWKRITTIRTNASSEDTGLYEVERMKNEV